MSLQLKRSEDFSTGVLRLINEEISTARGMLSGGPPPDLHETIHELRKIFKELRAIFRLIRDGIGEDEYQKENIFYRDLGRRVSEIRDTTAIMEAIERLQSEYQKEVSPDIFNAPYQSVYAQRQKMEDEFLQNDTLGYLKLQLDNKLNEHRTWTINIEAFDQIAPSLIRVYKRGQSSLEKAKATRATEDLHDWRKRVKYLRYQIDTLSVIWPGIMGSLEDELHDLSDLLGFDHDLSIIHEQIANNLVEFSEPVDKALVVTIIEHYRKQLQWNALVKGQNCYYEKPALFVERINAYWSNYEKKTSVDSAV